MNLSRVYINGVVKPIGKTETLFKLLQKGPKTAKELSQLSGFTTKQVWNLLRYHIDAGNVKRNAEKLQYVSPIQKEIDRCVAFLEQHGYEFD